MSGIAASGRVGRLAAAGMLVLALLAAGCGSNVTDTEHPWGPISTYAPQHLPPGSKADIDRVLDTFVTYGVERHTPGKAFAIASPMLRGTATRAQWAKGDLPVAPFDARGTTFHGYTVLASSPTQVLLTMVLQSRHPRLHGAIAYNIRVSKIHGLWRLDWFTPSAFFAPTGKKPRVFAEPDIAPSAGAHTLAPKKHGSQIFLGILAILCLPAVAVVAFVIVNVIRDRRRRGATPVTDDHRWADELRRFAGKP